MKGFVLIIAGIILAAVLLDLYAYGDTTVLSQTVYDKTFVKNATNLQETSELSTFHLLAGEDDDRIYLSTLHMNTHNIPKSDFWNDIAIESVFLKMLVISAEGPSEEYFLTVHVCTNEYHDQLSYAWLRGLTEAVPHSVLGNLETNDCDNISPHDSVVIRKNELPKIVEFDVKNLTREMIKLGAIGVIYLVSASPLDESGFDFDKLPTKGSGFLLIASKSSLETYGSNTVATLSISYSSKTTEVVENLTLALFIIPPFAAIGIPLAIHLHNQKTAQRDLLNRASRSVLRELNGNADALEGRRGYQVIEYNTAGKNLQHVRYTNAFLDDDAYNSIIASGHFTHFSVNTQDVLRELYTRIKDHNDTIRYTNDLEDRASINRLTPKEVSSLIERYDLILTKLENDILQLLPQAVNETNNELE